MIAQCSSCGELGRLWLGVDEDGATVHLRHEAGTDTAFVCGRAVVARALGGRRYQRPTTTTFRPSEDFYRERRQPSGEVGR